MTGEFLLLGRIGETILLGRRLHTFQEMTGISLQLFFDPLFVGGQPLCFYLMGAGGTDFCPSIDAAPAEGAKEINLPFDRFHRLFALGASRFVA